jgi:hypothetical protein
MVTCVCAPAIEAEMADWVALGGGNSGCCGDQKHRYGFHLAGGNVPVTDYSRSHEPGRPADLSWAAAADFSHGGKPHLRAKHAIVLARLVRGELPMICEFIGQPYAGEPVLYWARWLGTKPKKYTGKGHDRWSHISWWRSQADKRAYLWAGGGITEAVATRPRVPGMLDVDGELGPATIRRWQELMGLPTRDGVISRGRSELVAAVQRHLNIAIQAGLRVDGDGIRQDGRRYKTTEALQHYLKTPADGRLSAPKSMGIQALQRALNGGKF